MVINASIFYKELLNKFPYPPTSGQSKLFLMLSDFILSKDKNSLFLIKGYAGTGKTTTLSTLVHNLWRVEKKSILLAPTGRAAKVMSVYSRKKALTIHKKIYFPKKQQNGSIDFVLQPNKHTHTIFIVDEASMIPDGSQNGMLFDKKSLLDDLISYVYSGYQCRLILVGDIAQLPPVKLNLSPALDENILANDYDKNVQKIELDEVTRQHEKSGILANASILRALIASNVYNFKFDLGYQDVIRLIDGYDIEDAIIESYKKTGIEDTALIVYSNKRANLYNQQIRSQILGHDHEISSGDYIMVVKNNYYWLQDSSEAGFIANGDICEVLKIISVKDLYGFRFAEVEIRMIDYPNQPPFETVLILDTLKSESPSLSYQDSNRLYEAVKEDYLDEKSKYKQLLAIKKNKFFNALQVKFSYAITCHKSQGGQWQNVFVEQPYLPKGPNKEYMRWLYTAMTRAQEKLCLIGFANEYFKES